jgi:hypothetical protein
MYLAGHGSHVRPRLIELQFRRIERYRDALRTRLETVLVSSDIYADFRLPKFGMGMVDLGAVPAFERLLSAVKRGLYSLVFIDLDESGTGLTPDYECAFVRDLIEAAGAKVFNVFGDDEGVLHKAVKARCGPSARSYEVTEGSDIVCFFPSLVSEIVETALHRELEGSANLQPDGLRQVQARIKQLGTQRPYSGGGKPFVEARLSAEWQKRSYVMDDTTRNRLETLSVEEQRARFEALRAKLGIANPQSITGGAPPTEAPLEEHEEYQFLKKLLGYG